MEFKELSLKLLRNWWVVVLAIIVTTASTAFIGMQQTPVYQATATVELLPSPALGDNQMISIINVLSNRRTVINTYARKATSTTMKENVAAQLGIPASAVYGANISASQLPETTLIEIRAQASDPQLAANIANGVAEELISEAPDMVMVFELVDLAMPAGSPVEPQLSRLLTLGAVTGVVLGLLFALGLYLLQRFLETRASRKSAPAQALASSSSK